MEFTERQKEIITIVKEHQPITADRIAHGLGFSRATIRNDLAILTMTGILDARPKVGYIFAGQEVEPLLFDTLFKAKVSELMVPPLLINQGLSIHEAITSLFMNDVGSLYVINESQKLVGVISRKDLLRAAISNTKIGETPVAVIMTRYPNIATITQSDELLSAGYLLIQHQVDSLPVVAEDDGRKVVGKISKTKIMEYFIRAGLDVAN